MNNIVNPPALLEGGVDRTLKNVHCSSYEALSTPPWRGVVADRGVYLKRSNK